jgi:hypothetical protein
MALVACGECGKQVSNKAAACPHCGNPAQTVQTTTAQQAAASNRPPGHLSGREVAWMLGSVLAAFVLFGYCTYRSEFRNKNSPAVPVPAVVNRDEQAKTGARSLVYENLKAPSTASFESVAIVARQPPKYIAHVVVDAENSFGAKLRSSYLVAIELAGDGYKHRPAASLQEINGSPSEAEVIAMRALNGWMDEVAATGQPAGAPR